MNIGYFAASICAAVLITTGAFAADDTIVSHYCSENWASLSPENKTSLDYNTFIANCVKSAGGSSTNSDLDSVTGLCKDGSNTTARNRAEACSQNGGLAMWFAGK